MAAASFTLIMLSIAGWFGEKRKIVGERMVGAIAPQRAPASAVTANVSRASSKGLVRLSGESFVAGGGPAGKRILREERPRGKAVSKAQSATEWRRSVLSRHASDFQEMEHRRFPAVRILRWRWLDFPPAIFPARRHAATSGRSQGEASRWDYPF